MSRLENSVKNIVFSFGNTILASILSFISRTVFIHILGTDYLGLAGLLGNVLGFLSISELGIATAIGFSLYKPLAEKDYKVVSSLMSLYRKAYSIIGTIVLVSGILLFFFWISSFPLISNQQELISRTLLFWPTRLSVIFWPIRQPSYPQIIRRSALFRSTWRSTWHKQFCRSLCLS